MTTPPKTNGPISVSSDLALALAKMTQVLLAAQNGDAVVDLVTELAVQTLPGTAGAGVTLVDAQGKHSRSASDPLVEEADQLQYLYDAGPCLSAWRDQTPMCIEDMTAEVRWPEWTAAVTRLGVRSMLSVPMLAPERSMGAIKVYSLALRNYDKSSVTILELFAKQASILLANTEAMSDARQLSAELTSALDDRDVVGHAAGVLLAQGAPDIRAAVETLRSGAQRSGTTMHGVAQGIVDEVTTRHSGGSA